MQTSFVRGLQLLALLSLVFALMPAGAHLFSLANKMQLAPDQYMAAQRAYDGWALFGIVIVAAIILAFWHAYAVRSDSRAKQLSLVAGFLILLTQAIFWIWTYPMNVATANWTVMPADFEHVRAQWEYSHAANAAITLAAFVAMLLSVIETREPNGG
jgi:hypothetical protein